jgi:hypothetical protein
MPRDQVEALRDALLEEQNVYLPLALDFHLPPDGLYALPPRRLHLYVVVQPTVRVDVLEAL